MLSSLLSAFWLWVWGGILDVVQAVADAFGEFVGWVVGLGYTWFQGLYVWAGEQLSTVSGMLGVPTWFWPQFEEYMSIAAYWIPINQMIGIWGGYIAIVRAIRATRWVMSFIPGL